MKIAFVTESLSRNSLGRTFSLWLLSQQLGWDSHVFTSHGDEFWAPLKGTTFEAQCTRVTPESLATMIAPDTDLIVAVKPLERSLGAAIAASRARGFPLLADVDDPDLENRLSLHSPLRFLAKLVLRPRRTFSSLRLRRRVKFLPSIVSNPWLQTRYGGVIVPHAREDTGDGSPHLSQQISVVFVGTNREHKGVSDLRDAVARMQGDRVTLTVTDEKPIDAQPWESWVGHVPFERGIQLVKGADVVIIPSRESSNAHGQLPAKLMDAMLAGRAIGVSDIEPMPWALGGSGLLFAPGDVAEIQSTLIRLLDPAARTELGKAARTRALASFTVDACASAFREACESAITGARL